MRVRILFLSLSLFAFWGTVSSRAGQQPVQSGRVTGNVLDAATGEPLKDARVILQSSGSGLQQEIMTDDKGSFVVEEVRPGSYFLHAERAGYITDHLPQGYARPVPLSVNIEGGRDYPITLRLVRTASISGRIYNVDRQPVAKAELW